jgi:hypothetical protein
MVISGNVYPAGGAQMLTQPSSHDEMKRAAALLRSAARYRSLGDFDIAADLEKGAEDRMSEALRMHNIENIWCAAIVLSACVAIIVAAGLVGWLS